MVDWAADLLSDRAWAPELFVGADAVLSALKQVHVEAGDAFAFLAAELIRSPGGTLTLVTPNRHEATIRISHATIEEAADAIVFFAFVWATLHAGGPLVAAGARVLISTNTWTPAKRKRLSPWRSLDRWIAELGPVSFEAQARIEAFLAREWLIFRELWPEATRLEPGSPSLGLDLAQVRGGFRAAVGSPSRAWLEGLLRRRPELTLTLANLYARYAVRAGFGASARISQGRSA
jgi:hypothetical protein